MRWRRGGGLRAFHNANPPFFEHIVFQGYAYTSTGLGECTEFYKFGVLHYEIDIDFSPVWEPLGLGSWTHSPKEGRGYAAVLISLYYVDLLARGYGAIFDSSPQWTPRRR